MTQKFEVKKLLKILLSQQFINKLVAYLLLVLFLYIFKDFLLILFLTFIFTYLFLSLWRYLKEKIDKYIEKFYKNTKSQKIMKKIFSLNKILIFEYIIFVILLIFTLSHVIPKIIEELVLLPEKFPFIRNEVDNVIIKLQDLVALNSQLWWSITDVLNTQGWDLNIFIDIFQRLKSAWAVFLKILISIILSFIFTIDRERLKKYFSWMKKSNFSFLYFEYKDFFDRIVKSFWKILKAQALIALYNTIFTAIWIYVIWQVYWTVFPYFFTLIIFVFVCWLIPVLWTFISSIPILFIAYNIGWVNAVFYVLILITLIHAIEAYFLNPRIVSAVLSLPVSLTFVILLISEHLFWFAWLIIWMWLYYFLEWLFRDADKWISKTLE